MKLKIKDKEIDLKLSIGSLLRLQRRAKYENLKGLFERVDQMDMEAILDILWAGTFHTGDFERDDLLDALDSMTVQDIEKISGMIRSEEHTSELQSR